MKNNISSFLKKSKRIIENNTNKIISNWKITKIIISFWLSYFIVKTIYLNNIFIYNLNTIKNILLLVLFIAIILYFSLNSLLNILKK